MPPSRRGGRSRHLWSSSPSRHCRGGCATNSPSVAAERSEAERQAEVVGRDAGGVEVTRDEDVARGEPRPDKAKRAFEEKAGPVDWSAEDES
jgi:hypothetical protein